MERGLAILEGEKIDITGWEDRMQQHALEKHIRLSI